MYYYNYKIVQESLKRTQEFYIVSKMFDIDKTIDPDTSDFEELVFRGHTEIPFYAENRKEVIAQEAILVAKVSQIWWKYVDAYGMIHKGSINVDRKILQDDDKKILLDSTIDCRANPIDIIVVAKNIIF